MSRRRFECREGSLVEYDTYGTGTHLSVSMSAPPIGIVIKVMPYYESHSSGQWAAGGDDYGNAVYRVYWNTGDDGERLRVPSELVLLVW